MASTQSKEKEIDNFKKQILNVPPSFPYQTDPDGNEWYKRMIANAPIVTFIPGKGKQEEDIKKIIKDAEKAAENAAQTLRDSLNGNNEKTIEIGDINNKDPRLITFEATPNDYTSVVNQLLRNLKAFMGGVKTDALAKLGGTHAINFFVEKSTSVSESQSNTFGDSAAEKFSNMAKDFTEGLQSILQTYMGVNANWNGAVNIDNNSNPNTTSIGNTAIWETIKGNKLLLPKIWQSSELSRSYNIKLVFQATGGSKTCVFEQVYKPFLHLLALVLPRPTNEGSSVSYGSPFLVRVDYPGHFRIDIGAVSSLNIVKGGNSHSYTKDGLLKRIEVDVELIDLYGNLLNYDALSSTSALNVAMHSYLANLAGANWRFTSNGASSLLLEISKAVEKILTLEANITDSVSSFLSATFNTPIYIFNNITNSVSNGVNNISDFFSDTWNTISNTSKYLNERHKLDSLSTEEKALLDKYKNKNGEFEFIEDTINGQVVSFLKNPVTGEKTTFISNGKSQSSTVISQDIFFQINK
jgi:hypothetical protein